MRKFFIVRHGETEYNRKGIVQGSGVNAPLNDRGRQQAQLFYEAYGQYGFDHLYTSALLRTHQSVSGFMEDGLMHTELADFNEIHWGDKEGKPFTPEDHDEYLRVTQAWQQGDLDARIGGGESATELGNRMQAGLEKVLNGPGEQVLICMHGRAMRALLCRMLGYPLTAMDAFKHTNLCLYQLDYTGSMFRMNLFNEQAHLREHAGRQH